MRLDYSPFFRSTVGFDRLLDLLDTADAAQGYPPYNIERSDENNYRVTVAVAGFAEKDLGVEVADGVLTVTGKREDRGPAGLSASGHRRARFRAQVPAGRACRGQRRQARERAAACRSRAHRAGGQEAPPDRDQCAGTQDHRRRQSRLTYNSSKHTLTVSPARRKPLAGEMLLPFVFCCLVSLAVRSSAPVHVNGLVDTDPQRRDERHRGTEGPVRADIRAFRGAAGRHGFRGRTIGARSPGNGAVPRAPSRAG